MPAKDELTPASSELAGQADAGRMDPPAETEDVAEQILQTALSAESSPTAAELETTGETPAPLLRLNTRLRHADREYLVQSTVDPASRRMRSDIFGEGVRLMAVTGRDFGDLPTERIFPQLKKMHERTTEELDRIFKLSQSAAETREPSLLNYIGELFSSRRMWLEARREFDRAVLLNPEYDRALYNLGRCYLELNLYSEAAEYLERAVRLKPDFPDYLNRLGEAFMEMSSCRKAVDQFRRAAQANAYFWEPYYNMGLVFILNGIRREDYRMHVDLKRKAVDMFEKAAVIVPAIRNGKYFLGQRYLEEDRLSESYAAYAEARKALSAQPQPIPVSPLDLSLCSERFMPTEAELSAEITRLREAVKIHPHYADLRFRLAQSYTILAQLVHRRAMGEYDRALAINPEFGAARRNLKLSQNEDKGMSVLVKATLRGSRPEVRAALDRATEAGKKRKNHEQAKS